MSGQLEILAAGPALSLQDLGRPGFRAQGLTIGGAADRIGLAGEEASTAIATAAEDTRVRLATVVDAVRRVFVYLGQSRTPGGGSISGKTDTQTGRPGICTCGHDSDRGSRAGG